MPRLPRKGSEPDETPTDDPIVETHPSTDDVEAAAPAEEKPKRARRTTKAAEPEPVAEAPVEEAPAAEQTRTPIQNPADKIAASQTSRVSVVNESRPAGEDDDEYQWHTGL